MDYNKFIPQLQLICEESAEFIRSHFGKIKSDQVDVKEKNSLVSFVDKESEKMITCALKQLLPESSFLTEEKMVDQKESAHTWIVDPLDGTTNFLIGVPHFAISIGLKKEGMQLGVVYDVMRGDFYHAIKGQGAFLNHTKIKVAPAKKLDECTIATGFPYNKNLIGKGHELALMHYLKNARALRRLGAAALDLSYVAKGNFDLYYERFLNAWDLAAGILLVTEAGGITTDMNGKQNMLEKGEIIACSKGMEKEIEQIINNFTKM